MWQKCHISEHRILHVFITHPLHVNKVTSHRRWGWVLWRWSAWVMPVTTHQSHHTSMSGVSHVPYRNGQGKLPMNLRDRIFIACPLPKCSCVLVIQEAHWEQLNAQGSLYVHCWALCSSDSTEWICPAGKGIRKARLGFIELICCAGVLQWNLVRFLVLLFPRSN